MSQNANTSTNGLWYQHCFDMPRNNAPGKQHLGVTLWQPVGVSCLSMVTLKTIVVGWVTLDRQQKRNFASELEVTACTKAPSFPIYLQVLTTRTGIIKRQVSPFPLQSPRPLAWLVLWRTVTTWQDIGMALQSPCQCCYIDYCWGGVIAKEHLATLNPEKQFVCTCVHALTYTQLSVSTHRSPRLLKWRLSVS